MPGQSDVGGPREEGVSVERSSAAETWRGRQAGEGTPGSASRSPAKIKPKKLKGSNRGRTERKEVGREGETKQPLHTNSPAGGTGSNTWLVQRQ